MAEYLALPSSIKMPKQGTSVKEARSIPRNSHCRAVQRKRDHGRGPLSAKKMCELRAVGVENLEVHPHLRETSLRCNCLGFLMNPDGVIAFDWVPVGGQVLLMASIFLTYLAGVVPVQKSNITSQKEILAKKMFPASSTSPGSCLGYFISKCSVRKNDNKANLKCAWQTVREKLFNSLYAIECGSNLGDRVLEFDQHQAYPLSLCAVSEGPKLRLLWASFHQLEKEAGTVYVVSLLLYLLCITLLSLKKIEHFTCLDERLCWFIRRGW